MATETQTCPQITILTRVYSIPLVASSLTTIDDTLSSNAYTCSPYSSAKGFSSSAYKYAEPIQVRLAPLITRADGIANKAVDFVESRYPLPFTAKPEELASYVRSRSESVSELMKQGRQSANKTFDQVSSPAYSYAQAIDSRFSPIVDILEGTVTKLNPNGKPTSSPPAESKYQYQRALRVGANLKDNVRVYSGHQFKELQAQHALLQRVTETAQTITTLASSSIHNAQSRIYSLSDTMLADLKKLQSSLTPDFSDLSAMLQGLVVDLTDTIKSDLPLNEKVGKLGTDVKENVSPVLVRVSEVVLGKKSEGNGDKVANGDGR